MKIIFTALVIVVISINAQAVPVGVNLGNSRITDTSLQQTTNRATINWHDFNTGPTDVIFRQPSTNTLTITSVNTTNSNSGNVTTLMQNPARLTQPNTVAAPDLNKLSPSADSRTHPELMNLSTVDDNAELSSAK